MFAKNRNFDKNLNFGKKIFSQKWKFWQKIEMLEKIEFNVLSNIEFSKNYISNSTYSYWNGHTRKIDIESLLDDLNNAPDNSIVVLQVCCHNPTGIDPTKEQWKKIASVVIEKSHFCVFDSAFQVLKNCKKT